MTTTVHYLHDNFYSIPYPDENRFYRFNNYSGIMSVARKNGQGKIIGFPGNLENFARSVHLIENKTDVKVNPATQTLEGFIVDYGQRGTTRIFCVNGYKNTLNSLVWKRHDEQFLSLIWAEMNAYFWLKDLDGSYPMSVGVNNVARNQRNIELGEFTWLEANKVIYRLITNKQYRKSSCSIEISEE